MQTGAYGAEHRRKQKVCSYAGDSQFNEVPMARFERRLSGPIERVREFIAGVAQRPLSQPTLPSRIKALAVFRYRVN